MKTSYKVLIGLICVVAYTYTFYFLFEDSFWARNIQSSVVDIWAPQNSEPISKVVWESLGTGDMIPVDLQVFKDHFASSDDALRSVERVYIFSGHDGIFYITRRDSVWFAARDSVANKAFLGTKMISSQYKGNGKVMLELGPTKSYVYLWEIGFGIMSFVFTLIVLLVVLGLVQICRATDVLIKGFTT